MAADINLVFCTAQNVFGASTTVQSTDWIDWKVAQDLAGGDAPVLEIIVTTTAVGGTGMQFQLCTCNAAGTILGVLDTTAVIPTAQLVAPVGSPPMGGFVLHLRMRPQAVLPGSSATHLRVQVVNAGTTTAGAITAHLVPEAASALPNKSYASGY